MSILSCRTQAALNALPYAKHRTRQLGYRFFCWQGGIVILAQLILVVLDFVWKSSTQCPSLLLMQGYGLLVAYVYLPAAEEHPATDPTVDDGEGLDRGGAGIHLRDARWAAGGDPEEEDLEERGAFSTSGLSSWSALESPPPPPGTTYRSRSNRSNRSRLHDDRDEFDLTECAAAFQASWEVTREREKTVPAACPNPAPPASCLPPLPAPPRSTKMLQACCIKGDSSVRGGRNGPCSRGSKACAVECRQGSRCWE